MTSEDKAADVAATLSRLKSAQANALAVGRYDPTAMGADPDARGNAARELKEAMFVHERALANLSETRGE